MARLPAPASKIPAVDFYLAQQNRIIEQSFTNCVQKGQDYEVGAARIILKSPNGTRFYLTVDNSGNLSATPA